MNKAKVEIANQILERLNDLRATVNAKPGPSKRRVDYLFGITEGLTSALAIICEEGE
ncbi:hypothetical protein GKC32_09370 [Lactobacillus curvatus]|nr:hypothetical protein [Latilactobacillus curvatus]MSD84800.1 hypothetical protein [Latilactobacillus curvatus]MSE24653.1 hypothetical protein [Latilactobacillus curvatus]